MFESVALYVDAFVTTFVYCMFHSCVVRSLLYFYYFVYAVMCSSGQG